MENKVGSCGCGKINYSVNEDMISIINCHCKMCRAHNGVAFTSYVIVPNKSLEIVDDSGYLRNYSKDKATKYFCGKCGTPIYNAHDDFDQIYLIYLGTFKDASEFKPKMNTWCENQLSWVPSISSIKSVVHGS